MKITEKKQVNYIAFLFAAAYMTSYITRINYGAIIAEIEKVTGLSKSLLSMAVIGSFITYGAGQIVSGIIGDRVSPKKMVSCGFVITIIMNLLITVCQSPYQMLFVWSVNGFAQSMMWPPMVKLMSALLSDADYKRVSVIVSWGSSFGTIFIYLISPLVISLSGWKAVFVMSALCAVIMLFLWNKSPYDAPPVEKKISVGKEKNQNTGESFVCPVVIAVMVAIILQGMLRDGVTTWMPSYISETYNLSSTTSILTGVILPVFSIICLKIASELHKKIFTNPVLCAGVLFGIGALASFALYAFGGSNAEFSVVLSAVLVGCMHGVNLMLVCMVPAFFARLGKVSTVSGIINSCTYVGSAVSSYGIAIICEKAGWQLNLLIWLLTAVSGTLICLLSVKAWNKKFFDGERLNKMV